MRLTMEFLRRSMSVTRKKFTKHTPADEIVAALYERRLAPADGHRPPLQGGATRFFTPLLFPYNL
jgi:hypothetical protein